MVVKQPKFTRVEEPTLLCNHVLYNKFPMPSEWNLYYPSWMIADGEPDRKVGEAFEWFAVEFWTVKGSLERTDERRKEAIPVADNNYQVVAEVAYLSEKACVIDFGLRAIRTPDLLSPACKQGDYVMGKVSIGLPLCTEVVPEQVSKTLTHRWRVNRISADLTPYVRRPNNLRFDFRDETQIQYQEVESTTVLRAHTYILHCSEIF
jgi:hypothetical protein